MKVTLLKKPDTIEHELSTINYGKTELQIEINEILIDDYDGTSFILKVNDPIDLNYGDDDDLTIYGSVDLTCYGYNDCYKYEFDLTEDFGIDYNDLLRFGPFFENNLRKPTHIGIDLNKSAIMIKEDAYNDLVEGLTEEADNIIKEIAKKLNAIIKVEE